MEKLINKTINYSTNNVDVYYHENCLWLVFSNKKQWVVMLTKYGTLLYNYQFFRNTFGYLSLDVNEHQNYITKWAENFLEKKIANIQSSFGDSIPMFIGNKLIEDIVGNGIKETHPQVTNILHKRVMAINPITHIKDIHVERIIKDGDKC